MHCHTVPVLVDISAVSRQTAWEMGMTSLVDGNCLPQGPVCVASLRARGLLACYCYLLATACLLACLLATAQGGALSPITVVYCTKQTAAQRSTSTICSAHKRLTNGCTPRPMPPSIRSSNPPPDNTPTRAERTVAFPRVQSVHHARQQVTGWRLLACQLLGPGSIINLEVLHVQCILNLLLVACVHRVAALHRLSR